MKKIVKIKQYNLKMPGTMWVEIDKYAIKHDLKVAQAIRKAIKNLLKGQ